MKSFDVSDAERELVSGLAGEVITQLKKPGISQHLLVAALAEAGVRALEEASAPLQAPKKAVVP